MAMSPLESAGEPFLTYPDSRDRERTMALSADWDRITIGRGMSADLPLTWDAGVSRMHAELARLGDEWVVVDDGLSQNGTFVNGDRVERRRRLFDGDEIKVGGTEIRFHAPFQLEDATRIDHPRQP